MLSYLKVSALAIASATVLATVGCSTQSNNSANVVAPAAIPGNAAHQVAPLIANSDQVRAEAQNVRSVVHFAFDSFDINAEAAAILNEQVAFLAKHPDASVLVAGHTDERGSTEYNHALGQRRAEAVKAYLASQGVPNARVETISYGEDRLLDMGTDEASHAKNRRAELSY